MLCKPLPAPTVYKILEFTKGLSFTLSFTMAALYRVRQAGFDPLQLVLLGTLTELTVLLFEVPTGVVADSVSRRTSIIIGLWVVGAGFMLEGAVPRFGAIAVGHCLWGLGATFISGADVAWITDEVGEEAAAKLYVRGAQFAMAGGAFGVGLSVALATVALGLPTFCAGALLACLGLWLRRAMPEQGFVRPAPGHARRLHQSLRATLREGARALRARPALWLVGAVALLQGASTEGFDRLWEVQFLQNFRLPGLGPLPDAAWFGLLGGTGLLLGAIGNAALGRWGDASRAGALRALLVVHSLLVAALVAFGLARNFWLAAAAYWAVALLRSVGAPLYTSWLNRGLDPRSRATVNSMVNQFGALGQIAGGPGVGYVAVIRSVRAAMVVSGLAHSPVLLVLARALGGVREAGPGDPPRAPGPSEGA